MDRQSLRDWVHRFNERGSDGLVDVHAGGRERRLSADQRGELAQIVEAGPDPATDGVVRWRRVDIQRVIKERYGVDYHERYVGTVLAELGFSRLSGRLQHPGQDERVIEIWSQDEARIGQKNGRTRIWARKGTRPRLPADQRYKSAYLFGAICPARGTGAALALPFADTPAMQLHLDEISRHVARRAHAVLLLDRAGWHTTEKLKVPKNLTLIFLPSRSPELNPVENIWQYLRSNWLSNSVFENHDAIIDAACNAWNRLMAQPQAITSIGLRKWAHVGQSK